MSCYTLNMSFETAGDIKEATQVANLIADVLFNADVVISYTVFNVEEVEEC